MRKWRSESALDLYNVILAVLLFASPWMFSLTNGTARMDFWICSAAVVAISLGAIFVYANWEDWANLLFGLWLVASPWILGFSHARPGPTSSRWHAPRSAIVLAGVAGAWRSLRCSNCG